MKHKGQRNAPNRIPDLLCAPCAKRLGGEWPVGESISTHFDFCGQCDEFRHEKVSANKQCGGVEQNL